MNNDLTLVSLDRSPRAVERFLKVSYSVYRNDPYWVAPLLSDVKRVFSDENPLFRHAQMQLWVAARYGQDVGRIAGILDDNHNHNHSPDNREAFFGFFESPNDRAVSQLLLKAASDWARRLGAARILGPMNPTTNDESGLLVDGFESSPMFMMTYNPRYYIDLLEGDGFTTAKNLLAYYIDLSVIPMDRLTRIAGKVRQRNPDISLRPILRKTLKNDLSKVKEVYNAAWEDNWGFVPMTDEEVDFMASRLKPLLMEGLVWLAENHQEPVGFLLATPDFNVALKPLRGRLLTLRIFGFIPYLFGWKKPPATRVITLGVKAKYRGKGLESALLCEGLKVGFNAGFVGSEASWILEDNVMMCRLLETIGGRAYKTYRIYEKPLLSPPAP
jgi:ribosomal protein S18 acetylase RimI-like enzyme